MQKLEWFFGNNKKISDVFYKIQYKKDLFGIVVYRDNLKEY